MLDIYCIVAGICRGAPAVAAAAAAVVVAAAAAVQVVRCSSLVVGCLLLLIVVDVRDVQRSIDRTASRAAIRFVALTLGQLWLWLWL